MCFLTVFWTNMVRGITHFSFTHKLRKSDNIWTERERGQSTNGWLYLQRKPINQALLVVSVHCWFVSVFGEKYEISFSSGCADLDLIVTCLLSDLKSFSPSNMLLFASFYPGFFRWVYERFRLPAAPVYGGFPVKFRTFLGDPIPYDPNINATELAEKVSELELSFFLLHGRSQS